MDDQKADSDILRLNAERKKETAILVQRLDGHEVERKADKEEMMMYSSLFHRLQEERKADRESFEDATTRLNRLLHQEQEEHKADIASSKGE